MLCYAGYDNVMYYFAKLALAYVAMLLAVLMAFIICLILI